MTGQLENTIAAISTPPGEGAISTIRVSGGSAIEYVAGIFRGKKDLREVKSHTAHFGRILDEDGNILDEVVCTVFRNPMSFTGEDTVEISCHGGMHVTRRVLESIIKAGAYLAKPGEFTERAFLNGKLDLSQAEAIADLIYAQSEKAYRTSLDQLEGSLSKKIRSIRDQLVESIGLLELELDFVEEDIELIDKRKVEDFLVKTTKEIDVLLNSYKYGKIWREGIRVGIIGAPNAGKSSLLNALLEEERSIVTDIPGTTRDFIEEKMTIDGVLFRMVDTAGLRKTKDPIEQEGVKRTLKVIKGSDILVLVHDSTKILNNDEIEFIENIRSSHHHKRLIILNNKSDLKSTISLQKSITKGYHVIRTSTISLNGIEDFKDELIHSIVKKPGIENAESVTITNERHYSALNKAKEGLTLSLKSLRSGESEEFIVVNLRKAIDSIGEIIGIVTTEDILRSVFTKFCIGK